VALFLPLLAQLTISVSAPDTAAVLEPIILSVEMAATGARPPRLTAPEFRSFSVGQTSASTYMDRSRAGGRVHVDVRYVLEASRPGDYVIPPFEARLGNETARTRPLRIVVTGTTSVAVPAIVTQAPFDATAPVSVATALAPDTVYIGEQFTYQVAVFVDEAVRNRLRRTPGFAPPELRGMLAYELAPVRGIIPARKVGDRRYEPHLYQRAIFPLVAGTHVIPSAELQYSLPLSYSFFSREESRVLRTDSLVVVARDLPAEGRPPDYAGAVGELSLSAAVDPGSARVGDPAVLTLKVSGTGNIKMLPRPSISVPWGALVPAQERVNIDLASQTVRGSKEFDWVITPHLAGEQELPALRYPYFNPKTERYEIAISLPETLTVSPGALIATEEAAADTTPVLPLRAAYRGTPAAPLHSRRGYWLFLITIPIPALLTTLARRPRRRKVVSAATILRTLKVRKKTPLSAGEVRRAYVNALAQRLQLTPGALSTRAEFARALRRAGVSSQATEVAVVLLGELDGAAYGTRPAGMSGLLRRAQESYASVDAEARVGGGSIGRAAPLVMSVLAAVSLSGALLASPQDEERTLFHSATQQYAARRFLDAERTFGEITRIAPGAPDAWANFGTAAWAASDTAAAVVGWQRALRMEPLASDVRERLTLIESPRLGSFAWVPPVPVSALVISIAALWGCAWLLALARAAGAGMGRSGPWVMGSAALLFAAGAVLLDERLASRDIAVVRESTMLRSLPALGSDAVLAVHPGDMARSVSRRGEWALVQLPTGREGWIESPMLIPIARD
jgi:hypothetical protein